MKKNAFTLVELLVVIIIVAVLAVLLVPNLMSMIDRTKEKQYDLMIETILDAADLYISDNIELYPGLDITLNNTGQQLIANKIACNYNAEEITVGKLIDSGFLRPDIKNPRDDSAINRDTKIAIYLDKNEGLRFEYDRAATIKGECRFSGANPDNYVLFDNILWRVITINSDGIKLIFDDDLNTTMDDDGKINIMAYDESGNRTPASNLSDYTAGITETPSGNFSKDASIKTYVDSWFDSRITKKNLVNPTNFCIKKINYSQENVDDCSLKTNNSLNVGLVSGSDFIYASSDSTCLSSPTEVACRNNNYLIEDTYSYFTMNGHFTTGNNIWIVPMTGNFNNQVVTTGAGVRPVIYLNGNVEIIGGSGSKTSPYQVDES